MINYVAVLVCGIAAMVVGFLWYGPIFGKAYMKVMGADMMSPEQKAAMKKSMGGMYFLQFVLSLITAGVLDYHIVNWGDKSVPAIAIALCSWFGFVMTTTAGAALWSGKSKKMAWKLFWISTGAQFLTFAVFGLILGAWH